MDLIKEINILIDKQYEEIKQSGKIYSGIEKIVKEIRWEEPSLAQHVHDRMMVLAEKDSMENRIANIEERLQTLEERMEPPEIVVNDKSINKISSAMASKARVTRSASERQNHTEA